MIISRCRLAFCLTSFFAVVFVQSADAQNAGVDSIPTIYTQFAQAPLPVISRSSPPDDPRVELSEEQQDQILHDIQQHQRRYDPGVPEAEVITGPGPDGQPLTVQFHSQIKQQHQTIQPSPKPTVNSASLRPRGRAEDAFQEELFLQSDRQKLYQQLKQSLLQQQRQLDQQREQLNKESSSPSVNVYTNKVVNVQPTSQPNLSTYKPLNSHHQSQINNKKPSANKNQQQQQQGSRTKDEPLQKQLHDQFLVQLLQRQDLLRQLKLAVAKSVTPTDEDQIEPVVLPKNATDVYLANGKRLQVIRKTKPQSNPSTTTPRATTSTTQALPTVNFDQLTKGVLPPGTDFKVIRHKDGGLEEIGNLPDNLPDKKVTFVFLEEQPDGSVKVKGVKGNKDGDTAGAENVDSIIQKLQKGDLKIPGAANPVGHASIPSPSFATPKATQRVSVDVRKSHEMTPTVPTSPYSVHVQSQSQSPIYHSPSTTPPTISYSPTDNKYSNSVPHFSSSQFPSPSPVQYSPTIPSNHNSGYLSTTQYPSPLNDISETSKSSGNVQRSLSPTNNINSYDKSFPVSSTPSPPTTTYRSPSYSKKVNLTYQFLPTANTFPQSVKYQTPVYPTPSKPFNENAETQTPFPFLKSVSTPSDSSEGNITLTKILKREGLFAMAKFLRDSGLESILNETGPYTIFIPTDKAFRALLVQLGGPDKANEKFKENPRLLSGLLLHHVVPGSFKISALQDEMTGVSLAGTQLRVNTYNTQDVEWNDVKVVTINGARVLSDQQDIWVPQGVAHSIDRVMFPLPVGDLAQTLRADRAKRFNKFIRAINVSGLTILSGTKTYTVFAPTDRAFALIPAADQERLLSDPDMARALVLRHVTPGSLYTAGMQFYQVRESLEPEHSITISKNAGQIKANNAQVLTSNIPATNGVIHGINGLL